MAKQSIVVRADQAGGSAVMPEEKAELTKAGAKLIGVD